LKRVLLSKRLISPHFSGRVVMKRLALPLVAALAVGAFLFGAKCWRVSKSSDLAEKTSVAPVSLEPAVLDVRTGDTFWGLSLDGVVPCSSMLVKGGGHLVSISRNSASDRKLHFHVRDTKLIELDNVKFRLTVTGDDKVHVDRSFVSDLASAVETTTN
jgi:hypothetical protein